MPRVSLLQTNFTAGELSPRLYGRVDVARYQNGAKAIRNGNVLVQGGVIRSYGTRFVVATKDSTKKSRLIPFVFSRTQAYVLEFGDLYMRVFKQDGTRVETSPGVAYEIVTPYTQAMLASLDYSQGADTMFLWHESVPTQRLQRFLDALWVIEAAPWVNPPVDEIGERISQVGTLSLATVGAGRTLNVPGALFVLADAGRTISSGAGRAVITGYTSPTQVTVQITRAFSSTTLAANAWSIDNSPLAQIVPNVATPVGGSCTFTAAIDTFDSTRHTGAYIRVNDGLVKISVVASAVSATGFIIEPLSGTTPAPADSWSLEFPVWNQFDGYPRTGTLWEQRLIAAGTARFPQTVWGTRTGEYLNFARGVDDDDGFAFTINSDEVNAINFMASGRALMAFTTGGEFTLQGGIEKPITPTNVQIRARSNHGCAQVRPVKIGREELFVQRAGRKVRAFSYNATNDDYAAPDVSILAEHITTSGITEMAWQKTPEPWLWAVRADGRMACCTYELQDENVVAWTLRETGLGIDKFESVAVIPDGAGGETVWVIANRVANGGFQRYVERLSDAVLCDSAILYGATGGPVTSLTGLAHLNGRDVDVVADGYYVGRFTVAAGAITVPSINADDVIIGLPYTTRLEMLTPELQMPDGTAQGNSMRIGEATLRFGGTVGGRINGQQIPTRTLDTTTLDNAPETTVGLERIENLGWDRGEAEMVIEQDVPLPFYLLNVARKVTVNS